MNKRLSIYALLLAIVSCNGGDSFGDDGGNGGGGSQVREGAYISEVFEFCPAPGQFVNFLPIYKDGDSEADMVKRVNDGLVGKQFGAMASLGGFGGYITFGFDHTIENKEGLCDLRVYGNAIPTSSEPAIIMVSKDENGDGVPNDTWYEIKGSHHADSETIEEYEVVYTLEDDGEITWTNNQGENGVVESNSAHTQSYFPSWSSEKSLTFKGTRLPSHYFYVSETNQWSSVPFDYGYADNVANADDASAIDLAWAVDADGNSVALDGVDFVRVYNATHQTAGALGESSPEITGAADLHYLDVEINSADLIK